MSLSDEQIKFQARFVDPGFQAMQEINEWFEHNRQPQENRVPQADEADSGVAEILGDLTDLCLLAGDVFLNGIEISALVGVGAAQGIASLPVILLTHGMLGIQSSETDRRNAEYAFGLMSPEGLVYFLSHVAIYGRAPSDTEMSSASHIFKVVSAINDIWEEIEKLATSSSALKHDLAAARIGKAAWSLHPRGTASSSAAPSPRLGPLPSPPYANASSFGLEFNRSDSQTVGGSVRSVQRQTFGAPSSSIWGDPQENQVKLSDGSSSRGRNSFGDLLPRYAGGTAEATQPTFQFLQSDGEARRHCGWNTGRYRLRT